MPAQHSTLRVLSRPDADKHRTPIGGAVLMPGGQIITACHVVNEALGRPITKRARPDGMVTLDFPFIPKCPQVKAKVVRWQDPFHGDLATLDFVSAIPASAEEACVAADRTPTRSANVRIAGFPESELDGVWVEGRVSGALMGGLVQIDDAELNKHTIEQGFSGSGIWLSDQDILVGILVKADPSHRVSAMSPSTLATERLIVDVPERGTDNWKLTFFRKNGLTSFVVDLGEQCSKGIEPYCGEVQVHLEAIVNHLTAVGESSDWETTPEDAFDEFRQEYVKWNEKSTYKSRQSAMGDVRKAQRRLAEKLRQPANLLFQQDLDAPMDDIFDEFEKLAAINDGQFFGRVKKTVTRYKQRSST